MFLTRRDFVKLSAAAGATAALPIWAKAGWAEALKSGLSDPATQPKFAYLVANALSPAFMYKPDKKGRYKITIAEGSTQTGLLDRRNRLLRTSIFGYKDGGQSAALVTWPGRTFQIQRNSGRTRVRWQNDLPNHHLLPVDTSLHWAYSLAGYEQYSIANNGVPIVTHLHGGHSDFQYDGNPEFFYSPGAQIVGPQWQNVPGGFTMDFLYENDVPAGSIWYHDHALGITRLNVYAGMAGFYFIRDGVDTGRPDNPLGLPAYPYEMALAVQDRMFTTKGNLFYPAFPGDPAWVDFITGEGLADNEVPQPSILAEFFGDHMLVNGVIWPRAAVERRQYRLRLLNGCDSRFLVVRFRMAASSSSTTLNGAGSPLPFHVIGADQGLAGSAMQTDTLVFQPGGRYDVVFDFSQVPMGSRVIMENIGGDAPFGGDFGGDLSPADFFPDRQTDRIMAFDVTVPLSNVPDGFNPSSIHHYGGNTNGVDNTRKVALFEGRDEYGRLQPLLGTKIGANWTPRAWHAPATETPTLGDTEYWDIYNFTPDAHPIHLHLVNFQLVGRNELSFDSDDGDPGQPVLQFNGTYGVAPVISNVVKGGAVTLGPGDGYAEDAPLDVVTALPEQVTRLKVTFDKRGRYVWHCHILSHEDHEMMRVMQVV